jgi:hypothetical protein
VGGVLFLLVGAFAAAWITFAFGVLAALAAGLVRHKSVARSIHGPRVRAPEIKRMRR